MEPENSVDSEIGSFPRAAVKKELTPTQPAEELNESFTEPNEDEENEDVWGQLISTMPGYRTFKLTEDEYSFGRDCDCDYNLSDLDGTTGSQREKLEKMVKILSNKHFTVKKVASPQSGFVAAVIDDSANGTFINGRKLGKGKQEILKAGDTIALGMAKNQVWVYKEKAMNFPFTLPQELTDQYMLSRELGRGACGAVHLCFDKADFTKQYAVKILPKNIMAKADLNGVMLVDGASEPEWNKREVEILRRIDHPNIIKVFGMMETPERVFIILELAEGGDLFNWLDKFAGILAKHRGKYLKPVFAQMVLAVKYLHDNGITHRDLKPENILASGELHSLVIKITDFGLSKLFSESTMLKTFCGTPSYLAPEILTVENGGTYTKAVDCWSIGVVLFTLLVNYAPFSQMYHDMPLGEQIRTARVKWFESSWTDIDPTARDICEKLIKKNPVERLTIDQVWSHEWFNDKSLKPHLSKLLPNLEWPPQAFAAIPKRPREQAFSPSPPPIDAKKGRKKP